MLEMELTGAWGYLGSIGPTARFRLIGGKLQAGTGNWVGEHKGEGWRVGSHFLTRLDVRGPVHVRFENDEGEAMRSFGPYSTVMLLNGYVMADGRLLAWLARDEDAWCLFDPELTCPNMVLEASSSS